MGCCGGDREKYGRLDAEQKWEYIVSHLEASPETPDLTSRAESR